jgi:hypothetical protein
MNRTMKFTIGPTDLPDDTWIELLLDMAVAYETKHDPVEIYLYDDDTDISYDEEEPAISVEEMRAHIERLVVQYDIFHDTQSVTRSAGAYALLDVGAIATPPIKGEISYATALHEIGHIRGRYQNSRNPMTCERWAWHWARANALTWTPRMERSAVEALDSHRRENE